MSLLTFQQSGSLAFIREKLLQRERKLLFCIMRWRIVLVNLLRHRPGSKQWRLKAWYSTDNVYQFTWISVQQSCWRFWPLQTDSDQVNWQASKDEQCPDGMSGGGVTDSENQQNEGGGGSGDVDHNWKLQCGSVTIWSIFFENSTIKGRAGDVFCEFEVWPKCYLRSCYGVHNIVSNMLQSYLSHFYWNPDTWNLRFRHQNHLFITTRTEVMTYLPK